MSYAKNVHLSRAKAFVTFENENETIINKEAGKMLRIQASELNLNTEKQSHFSALSPDCKKFIFIWLTAFTKKYCQECNLVKIGK